MTIEQLIAELERRVVIEQVNANRAPSQYLLGWLDAYADILALLKGE